MIAIRLPGQSRAAVVSQASIPLDGPTSSQSSNSRAASYPDDARRLRGIVDREHGFVWRSLRRLGVPPSDVDDAVQKVFLVTAQRLATFPPERDRSFLFATCMRIASNERRGISRRRSDGPDGLEAMASDAPSPEKSAADRSALDAILEPLPLELRSVLVLFECEGMTSDEIASLLDVPSGTVASRLRRGRELATATAKRLRAGGGGEP